MIRLQINTDGACNNNKKNPQPMGIGVSLTHDGVEKVAIAHNAGPGTSNEAEWVAMALGFKAVYLYLESIGNPRAEVYFETDSKLIVNHFYSNWLTKKPFFYRMKKIAHEYKFLIGLRFRNVKWVPREKNVRADELSQIGKRKPKQTLFIKSE